MDFLLAHLHASPVALWGLLALLILCGLGLPLPEDVILVAAGLIAGESGGSWLLTSGLMYAGVLAGDSLIFAAGRRFGGRLLAWRWIAGWLSERKRQRIARLLERHGSAAFFVARFMPGVRAPFYFTTGAMGQGYLRFAFWDALAALVSVPLFVGLGGVIWHKFGRDMAELSRAVARTHSYVLFATVLLVAAAALLVWFNRRKLVAADVDER